MLIKIPYSSLSCIYIHPILSTFDIIKYKDKIIKVIQLDYRLRIRFNNIIIPIKFLNSIIFINPLSFQQNNMIIAKDLRQYVFNLISCDSHFNNILCIGGESYIYALLSHFTNIFHLTNSKSIFDDCSFNSSFYKSKSIINNLVNYNTIKKIKFSPDIAIINLSNLNHNLMIIINTLTTKKIIIINCHHNDFWKKIKLFTNYKLITRKLFISHSLHYFITVNILIRKT